MRNHKENNSGSNLKDVILGGQDGLVNVLGVILGVAVATYDTKIIIIAGLAATFAESISMVAVAYTSIKAALSYYLSQLKQEKQEIKNTPKLEKKEIYDIYYKLNGLSLSNSKKQSQNYTKKRNLLSEF